MDHAAAETASADDDSRARALFADVESRFPSRLRRDGWYLSTVAALIASGQPGRVGGLYVHLVGQDGYSTASTRQRLVRRLREAMVKCIILVGIPVVMEAVRSLAMVERAEDQDHSFSREGWQADEQNRVRGQKALDVLYRGESDKIYASFGAHRDIPWISTEISYGLFLADQTILDRVETELVVLPAIMCQNLRNPTHWHLRACLRVGMTRDEVEAVQCVIKLISQHAGKPLDNVGRVADVEDEDLVSDPSGPKSV